jgi:transposase-like protein
MLRGESEEEVSRALGVIAATLSDWREVAVLSAIASLKSRDPNAQDEESQRLKAKIGELSMENELLYEKVHKLETKHPLLMRRLRP